MLNGRDERLVLRVSPAEKRTVESAARKARLTVADWIRERLGLLLRVGESK